MQKPIPKSVANKAIILTKILRKGYRVGASVTPKIGAACPSTSSKDTQDIEIPKKPPKEANNQTKKNKLAEPEHYLLSSSHITNLSLSPILCFLACYGLDLKNKRRGARD